MRGGRGGIRFLLCASLMLSALLAACSARHPKPFVVGIVNDGAPNDILIDGFKAAMAGLGYREGADISYMYNGVAGNGIVGVDNEITRVMNANPGAILAVGGLTVESAGRLLRGKKIPVIFGPTADPVGRGLAESLSRPGGNMTGIRSSGDLGKLFEWIMRVTPGTEHIFVPLNPRDFVTRFTADDIRKAASRVGVDPLISGIAFPDGMKDAITTLPDKTAIVILITPKSISSFCASATAHRIPVFSFISTHLAEGALGNYRMDMAPMGRQLARLMDKVIKGASPAEIPIETMEYLFTLNLKAERSLGLTIPDEILAAADTVEQ